MTAEENEVQKKDPRTRSELVKSGRAVELIFLPDFRLSVQAFPGLQLPHAGRLLRKSWDKNLHLNV